MKIVGCDLHTRYQQIAMLDEETGELIERRLEHASGEAKEFYTQLTGAVRVGIEATGTHALVRATVGGVRARVVGGRCGAHPRSRSAQAEDGRPRCGAAVGVAVERTISAAVAAEQ